MGGKPAFEAPSVFQSNNYRGIKYARDKDACLFMRACGIERCLPGYAFPRSTREGYHLHAVISGKGVLEAGGKTYPVHEGQLFLVKHMEETFYQADEKDPWYYVWATYEGRDIGEWMEQAGFTDGVYVLDSHVKISAFYAVIEEILARQYLTVSSELYRMGLSLRFLALAVESRELGEEKLRADGRGSLEAIDYVDYAVSYIGGNYAHIRISDVVKHIGISRSHFYSVFKKKMYMSPQEYLMQVRMNKSKELLLQTNAPIYVVAQQVGYEDQLTFSKMFKKKFGLSPEQYRRNR